ncbi:hypothetical protein C1893_26940 [Pseudomonas sp. MPR-ANC1]|nr:hypothetical protein C1893_26940 [Pseudomonas sp. MPR-ANC1]
MDTVARPSRAGSLLQGNAFQCGSEPAREEAHTGTTKSWLISCGQMPPLPETAPRSAARRCTTQTAPAPGSQSPQVR